MDENEEKIALDKAWQKIQQYVVRLPRFPRTVKIDFPHEVYSWTRFEIYPSGDCAILSGAHGNPGRFRPRMIHRDEEFYFGLGDNERSWYSKESDFPDIRKRIAGNPRYKEKYEGYDLLRKLVEKWSYVKSIIAGEVGIQKNIESFEA